MSYLDNRLTSEGLWLLATHGIAHLAKPDLDAPAVTRKTLEERREANRIYHQEYYKTHQAKIKEYRAARQRKATAFIEQGLTFEGNPLKITRHPELRGLRGKEYHLAYNKIRGPRKPRK